MMLSMGQEGSNKYKNLSETETATLYKKYVSPLIPTRQDYNHILS